MSLPHFMLSEAAEALQIPLPEGCSPENFFDGIVTDSRVECRGALFLALAGERFDGHDFLDLVLEKGAAALCINRDRADAVPAHCPVPVFAVPDTLKAYQRLARFHRNRFPALRVAAVTGSVGKTSVKEMIRAVFVEACGGDENAVLATEGNFNNQIGVPITLLRLHAGHRYAVVEAGTSAPGEIRPLAELIRPGEGAALVNAIAPCHLEKLLSLEGVAKEKSTIFSGLLPGRGSAVYPMTCAANEILADAARPYQTCRFGKEGSGAEVTSRYLGGTLEGSSFVLTFPGQKEFTVSWPLSGEHQALNAAAAAAVAYQLGIAPGIIAAGLPHTTLPGMRMKSVTLRGVRFLNDAYNANPVSMKAGLQLLAEATPEGRSAEVLLVLGAMRELGKECAAAHRTVLDEARRLFPDAAIIAIGRDFPRRPDVTHFDTSKEAAPAVAAAVAQGGIRCVFAKGSRGTAVELALPEEAR